MGGLLRRAYVAVADFDPFGSLSPVLRVVVAFIGMVFTMAIAGWAASMVGSRSPWRMVAVLPFTAFLLVSAHWIAHAHFPSATGERLRYLSFVYRLIVVAVVGYTSYVALR